MDSQPSGPSGGFHISSGFTAVGTLPILPAFDSPRSAFNGISALEQGLRSRHDQRAIFLTAYRIITRESTACIERGIFQDNVWVGRYLVSLGNLYRQALADFESDRYAMEPKVWLASFTVSKVRKGTAPAGSTAVNRVLRAATEQLKRQVESLYAPGLDLLDKALSPWDSEIADFSVDKALENAWESAVSMANARNDHERATIIGCSEDRLAVLAQLLVLPTTEHPILVPSFAVWNRQSHGGEKSLFPHRAASGSAT